MIIMDKQFWQSKALLSLCPDAEWAQVGEDEPLEWNSPDIVQPSEADLQTEMDRLEAEYDAQEYARNRAAAYPSNGDQWDMIYKDDKNGTTTHADAVEAVKTKWPKDNSGPV